MYLITATSQTGEAVAVEKTEIRQARDVAAGYAKTGHEYVTIWSRHTTCKVEPRVAWQSHIGDGNDTTLPAVLPHDDAND